MLYVGLDVHLRQSTFCVLDDHGRKVRSQTVRGPWTDVVAQLEKLREPFSVCFEASAGYGVLHDRLRLIARRVEVAHAGHLRLIFRSKHKNDRVDAEKLAKLLFLGEVPPVYVPSQDVRSWRRMIRHRQCLVWDRIRVKNRIRALLRNEGIPSPKGLWSNRGQVWLEGVELSSDLDAVQRDVLMERLGSLNAMVDRVDAELDQKENRHPGVQLLKTIPGVGNRTAEAEVAWIDDPQRFSRVRAIGRYFGLVPQQDSSASFNRMGHITREGPGMIRWLLVESTWHAIRRSPRVREFFERIRRDDSDRKKIALVATAHYLLRVMLSMLQTGEVWRTESSVG